MDIRQTRVIKTWGDIYLGWDLSTQATLNEAYSSYCDYCKFELPQIELSKKAFSKYLREYLTPLLDKGVVKITRKSEIIFKGLKIASTKKKTLHVLEKS